MKQGSFVCVCLVLVSLFTVVPAFSQSVTSYDSILIDNFDGVENMDWKWYVQGSRFVADGFPKLQYFEGAPDALQYFKTDKDTVLKVLGVESRWNRKGDNWMEIFPSKTNDEGKVVPYEVPLQGFVDNIDVWVWGANYSYNLDILIRDAKGSVHSLPMGKTNYMGWQNKRVNIPGWMVQRSLLRSGPTNLSFVGFRIKTDPFEYVDEYTIYFDNLKYLTNTFTGMFDGYPLNSAVFESDNKGAKK